MYSKNEGSDTNGEKKSNENNSIDSEITYTNKEKEYDKNESHEKRDMSKRGFDIEKLSFQIIEDEIKQMYYQSSELSGDDGHHYVAGYNELEWPIVRRVIHATADFDFAFKNKIQFQKDAIRSVFEAFENKCNIVTDVDMVLSAISKTSVKKMGLNTACHISDADLAIRAKETNMTRSELAMRKSLEEINGGIVCIGNAPTALLEVIKMVREGIARPKLVIGVPVGFVSAPESKYELMRTDIPYVTNTGRKGGSPVASSIINALMLLYQNMNS